MDNILFFTVLEKINTFYPEHDAHVTMNEFGEMYLGFRIRSIPPSYKIGTLTYMGNVNNIDKVLENLNKFTGE